jgi:beta-glucanase (GH16 family)
MLPTDEVYGGWAASGEIDIMELVGHQPARVHGTLHYGGPAPANQSSGAPYDLSSGTFADDFHVFAVEWEEGEIRWYVDGVLYQTQTEWNSTGGPFPAPFDQRFHLLLNVAVGGNWPGSPDITTPFPQTMQVDYVRVYQRD